MNIEKDAIATGAVVDSATTDSGIEVSVIEDGSISLQSDGVTISPRNPYHSVHWTIAYSENLMRLFELVDPRKFGKLRPNIRRNLSVSILRNQNSQPAEVVFAIDSIDGGPRSLLVVPLNSQVNAVRINSLGYRKIRTGSPEESEIRKYAAVIGTKMFRNCDPDPE
jgi:hypothetical protein